MTTRPGLPLYMTLEKSLFARLLQSAAVSSVTRLGDFLDFGLLFKAFGNNYFVQISHIVTQYFAKVSKSIIFLVKSFLGNFYRHLATFYWSHWHHPLNRAGRDYTSCSITLQSVWRPPHRFRFSGRSEYRSPTPSLLLNFEFRVSPDIMNTKPMASQVQVQICYRANSTRLSWVPFERQ